MADIPMEKRLSLKKIMRKIAIAEDWTIAVNLIELLRDSQSKTSSRSLWPYLEYLSPLDPQLYALVFKWKRQQNLLINLDELAEQEEKIRLFRELHFAFIEDWWFEIAQQMALDSIKQDAIHELECFKRMAKSGERGDQLQWLEVKVKIIKYFEQIKKLPVRNQSEIEDQKDREKVEQEFFNEIEQSLIKLNESAEINQDQASSLEESQFINTSSTSSQGNSNKVLLGQDQLKHFVKSAIYPLKEVSVKIKHYYDLKCISMYMRIVKFALEKITESPFKEDIKEEKSFKDDMKEKLQQVAQSTPFIKKILEEINSKQ